MQIGDSASTNNPGPSKPTWNLSLYHSCLLPATYYAVNRPSRWPVGKGSRVSQNGLLRTPLNIAAYHCGHPQQSPGVAYNLSVSEGSKVSLQWIWLAERWLRQSFLPLSPRSPFTSSTSRDSAARRLFNTLVVSPMRTLQETLDPAFWAGFANQSILFCIQLLAQSDIDAGVKVISKTGIHSSSHTATFSRTFITLSLDSEQKQHDVRRNHTRCF